VAAGIRRHRVPHKIIIDTDIGEDIDDILVTAFALNSPEFEVLAITTVDGDTQARSRIARRTTAAYGKPHIPVVAGYPHSMPRGDSDIAPGTSITQGELAPGEDGLPAACTFPADELIAQLAAEHPGEVWLLTIGSMTNIGQTFVRRPQAMSDLRGVITNGGGFARGPVSIGWNLRYDPLAAAVVARSGLEWALLPEDATGHACLRDEDVRRIREAGLETTDLLARAIDLWKQNKPDAAPRPHLADLNVFAHLLGDDWLPIRSGRAVFTIPPDGIADLAVEYDPKGPHLLGGEVPQERGAALRELFMDRILAPPARR
jgi:purine nucleosidase/pyrimidine-specific ribonucleoside hydrolase